MNMNDAFHKMHCNCQEKSENEHGRSLRTANMKLAGYAESRKGILERKSLNMCSF